ncbi:MAG: hypothetical protein OXE99_14280 [Cellvibrionales bacterium]|nr:hypothetical protein [Cellvibrionales bacterium]
MHQSGEEPTFYSLNIRLPDDYDTDNDGIPDSLDEDPANPNIPVKYGNLDLDNDGISNAVEWKNGTYDPNGDYDGDGFSNVQEYDANTNPAQADSLPKQIPDQGEYAAFHVHSSAITFLQSQSGGDFVWDESVLGVPVSLVPVYWDLDQRIDILVSTNKGTVYLLKAAENGLEPQTLISLNTVPTGTALQIGLVNIDSDKALELWAYHSKTDQLFLYKRQPSGDPFGSALWKQVTLADVKGHISLADFDEDGVVDVIASGVDLSVEGKLPHNTIALFKGFWNGVDYSLANPELITAQDYIGHAHSVLLSNIKEAGFDTKPDLLIKANDQKIRINLSFNSYKKSRREETLLQMVVTTLLADDAAVEPLGAQLDTGSRLDAFALANIDNDIDSTMDMLQYTGSLAGVERKFRLVKGIKTNNHTDEDGIPDYRDIDAENNDLPLPAGNIDHDSDGIPYAADETKRGDEDYDNDGMSDAYELSHGLDPQVVSTPEDDSDGDGRSDYEEFIDGTDPNDPSSVLSQQSELMNTFQVFSEGAADLSVVNNTVVVTSQNSPSVKIMNLDDLTDVKTIESQDINGVADVFVSNDQILLGNLGGSVEVWDAKSLVKLTTFNQHNAAITDMAVSGNHLFALHADGVVYQWDLQKLAYLGHWKVYDGFLTSIHIEGDHIYLQASSPQKAMFVWDVQKKEKVYTITGEADCCEKVVTESNEGNLLIANSFKNTGLYQMNTSYYNSTELVSDIDVTAIEAANKEALIGRKNGIIDIYSLDDGSFMRRVVAPFSHVRKIQKTDDGFMSLHSDGNLYRWGNK